MASEARLGPAALPHRPPFLFVDRVLERRLDATPPALVTAWDVPHDGWWFAGHYPGRPILPGVLIFEFAFQSAALLMAELAPRADDDADAEETALPVLVGVQQARLRRMVGPGATLQAEVELLEQLSGKHELAARVTHAGESVARLRFSVALAAAPEQG